MTRLSATLDEVAGGFKSDDSGHSSGSTLFRPEALAAAAENGIGRPIAVLPLSWSLLSGILATMVTALSVFLFVGTYTRKESAVGIVRAVNNDVRVAVPAPGIVKRTLVAEGSRVEAGDTLLIVDTGRTDMNGRQPSRAIMESLDRELVELSERLRSLEATLLIERRASPARVAALEGELAAAASQQASSAERLALAQTALAKLEPVAARGFISGETVRRRREEVIALKQSIADARGVRARLSGQLTELRTNIAQQPSVLIQKRGELQDLIARTRRERQSYAAQRGFTVQSPIGGTVSAIQAITGQQVDPQRTLMTVSPPSAAVSAEIFVPSRAIGFLETGQKVQVRYDAFPYQRFGSASGRVQAISSTVLRPEEVAAAVKIEEPVYRVVIELPSDRISAYGKTYRIRPGSALRANIILEERSFADWLLDPILALRGRL